MGIDLTDFVKTNVPGILKNKKTNLVININNDQYTTFQHGRKRSRELSDLKTNYDKLHGELEAIKKAIGLGVQ